jgi:uncharacterized Zn-binding protein involved in type VI secretion
MDSAGGKVITGSFSVKINNLPVVLVGSIIQDHGRNEHDAAKMIYGFKGVEVENIAVCMAGDIASCGHPLISNSNVEVGS